MREWMKLFETQILPAQVADEQIGEWNEADGETCTRIVWEKTSRIETNDLDQVGYKNVEGVYGLHVTGDIEYWFNQLVKDYDRDSTAYVIEIICLDTDVYVDDNQIMDKSESGDSYVLLTTRKELYLGKDFRYVRTLTEEDLEPEDEAEEDDGNGDSPW